MGQGYLLDAMSMMRAVAMSTVPKMASVAETMRTSFSIVLIPLGGAGLSATSK